MAAKDVRQNPAHFQGRPVLIGLKQVQETVQNFGLLKINQGEIARLAKNVLNDYSIGLPDSLLVSALIIVQQSLQKSVLDFAERTFLGTVLDPDFSPQLPDLLAKLLGPDVHLEFLVLLLEAHY